jgi:hypothetical protein
MARFLALATLATFAAALLAGLMWQERKNSLRHRLEPTLAILASLLILWALVRYGDALLQWMARQVHPN